MLTAPPENERSDTSEALKSTPQQPRVCVGGVTGDKHDRDRMVLRIQNEDGSRFGHLSFSIEDLHSIAELVSGFEPQLARLWAKRDGQR